MPGMPEKNKSRLSARDIVLCALFAALTAVGTFIKIPTPLLPITLQTLFVVLAGLVLGRRLGAVAIAVYVAAGLIGIPVFTQGGGPGYILNPTFGYIVSFIAGAWLAGFLSEEDKFTRLGNGVLRWFVAGVAAVTLIYAMGIPYYWLVARYYLGRTIAAETIIWTFVLMPLPGDIVSCFAAALAVKRLKALKY